MVQLAHDMRPEGPTAAPRRLQVVKEPHNEALERPKSFKIIGKNTCFLPSRLFVSDGLFKPQVGSKMAQDGPKSGPGWAPRRPQERPKSAPRGAQEAIFRAPRGGGKNSRLFWSMASKMAQESPKSAPRGPQEGPRWPTNVPKRALRWPQEAYKTLPERTIAKV